MYMPTHLGMGWFWIAIIGRMGWRSLGGKLELLEPQRLMNPYSCSISIACICHIGYNRKLAMQIFI